MFLHFQKYPEILRLTAYSLLPTLNPAGDYIYFTTGFKDITVTTTAAGANMRYTINGAPPMSTIGTLIGSSSGSVRLTPSPGGTTLQVIAFEPGMNDSAVNLGTYYYESGDGAAMNGSTGNSASMPYPGDGGPSGGPIPQDGQSQTISYDGNGNLMNYKAWVYHYDAQNRLTYASNGTTSAQFYYDGRNRQIARNINGVIRFNSWDGWDLLEEYSSSLNVVTGYLQGATGVIKSWSAANTLYYYQDNLASTTHVANANGQLVESYHYDLYGKPAESSTHGVVDLYAGERWIPELALYDLRNRFMSTELGRFLQPDPLGLQTEGEKLTAGQKAYFSPGGVAPEAFTRSEMNLYRYCGNDPVDRSDPFGLAPIPVKDDVDQKSREGLKVVLDIMKNSRDGMERAKSTGRDKKTRKVFIGEPTEIGKWNKTKTGQSVEIPGPGRGVEPKSGVHAHPDNHETDGNGNVRTDGKPGPIASNKDRKWADVVQRPIYTISENGRMIERYRPDDSGKRSGGVTERWNGHSWDPLRY